MKKKSTGFILPFLMVLVCASQTPSSAAQTQLPSLPGTFDPENVLARTARGEIPSAKLYEDDEVLAFLGDYPAAKGHFLVISKSVQARNFLDLTPEQLGKIMDVAQLVARAEILVLGAEGFTLRQNNGSASTMAIFHLHVIPRWAGDELKTWPIEQESVESLEPLAQKIRDQIQALED